MVNSMTGYGTASISKENLTLTVDIKSVNSRYLDINMRLPSNLFQYESELKNVIKQRVHRGKVDVYIKNESVFDNNINIEVNKELLTRYIELGNIIEEQFSLKNDLCLSNLVNNSNLFTIVNVENEEIKTKLLDLTKEALNKSLDVFIDSRKCEGAELYNDLKLKLDFIEKQVKFIEGKIDDFNEELREHYFKRVESLAEKFTLDNDRLYTEVALLIDKHCIDEEVVRLFSHIKQFREIIDSNVSVGKRLDFLVQEMNRESNTMLSKSKSVELSEIALSIKTEIEKIREQVQNIE